MNTALSHSKPVVSVLFDKSTWDTEGHELGSLLKEHGVCLDLSAGSGSALSHQYDQGQINALISYCNGTLYGTGDIHPPGTSTHTRARDTGKGIRRKRLSINGTLTLGT